VVPAKVAEFPSKLEVVRIREELSALLGSGRNFDVLEFLDKIAAKYGTLAIDETLPSLYNYYGVAAHNTNDVEKSEKAFEEAVKHFPSEMRSWINLGEACAHQFKMKKAVKSLKAAAQLPGGKEAAYPRLLRSIGWSNDWDNFENIVSWVEKQTYRCHNTPGCEGDGQGGLEYTNVPGELFVELSKRSPNAADTQFKVSEPASFWDADDTDSQNKGRMQKQSRNRKKHSSGGKPPAARKIQAPRLKVGVLSSDFGVHPVSSLIRGALQFISQEEIELFAFALIPKVSWWGQNITDSVEHFIRLDGLNTQDAAVKVASYGIEILIDLNGHTLHSGLPILSHRPAPVQISFLGLPTSTAAPFIDYYIGDYLALPAEMRDHFSEKLILLPTTVIANDYAQLQGDVLHFTGNKRASRAELRADSDLSEASFVFGTLSNYQKIEPKIFQTWMNILNSKAGSKLVTIEYAGHDTAHPNLRQYAPFFGISADRLALAPQRPWIEHLYAKTSYDMLLDTITKGGHTTGLDGAWAGVPYVTVPGNTMPARAGLSIVKGLGVETGLTHSLKEYEDVARKYATDPRALAAWRASVEKARVTSEIFDTRVWTL
jgi:predicted O-linked N-acetylglucosamine transferase (SPINDLY family)